MGTIQISIVDQTGRNKTILEVPDDIPIYKLIPALASTLGLPITTKEGPPIEYILEHRHSQHQLDPEDTMTSAGVKPGDEFALFSEVTAGFPIRTVGDIVKVNSIFQSSKILYAIILYTEQDKLLASYIRKNLNEINYMSGTKCLVFILEKPSTETKRGFRELTGKSFDNVLTSLSLEKLAPFDKIQAYKIGEYFGIYPSQFPCIVFFSDPSNKKIIISEINDFVNPDEQNFEREYTSFFRIIFSMVYRAMAKPRADWLLELEKLLSKRHRAVVKKHSNSIGIGSIELTKSIIEVIGSIVKTFF